MILSSDMTALYFQYNDPPGQVYHLYGKPDKIKFGYSLLQLSLSLHPEPFIPVRQFISYRLTGKP